MNPAEIDRWPALDLRHRYAVKLSERQRIRSGGRLHAGQRPQPLKDLFCEVDFPGRGPPLGQSYLERQHALGPEARVDVEQPREALDQQPGSDKQHEGQRHLRDDQELPEPVAMPARAAVAFLFERGVDVCAPGSNCRRESKG